MSAGDGDWRLAALIPSYDRADLLRRSIVSALHHEFPVDYTRRLNAEILNRYLQLPSERRILQRPLVDVHWMLGRISLRRRPVAAGPQVARVARTDRCMVADRFRTWCA
jgi:hypothetical protein